ncbi:hypothetical protein F5Y16DRAFT_149665 [Xylariaceae sp. FL0255]|nr:hypothetical protein F5Y16DRAFT_149665 [Xylariaceae sp. FL0255]
MALSTAGPPPVALPGPAIPERTGPICQLWASPGVSSDRQRGHDNAWQVLVHSVAGDSFLKEPQVVTLVQRRVKRLLDRSPTLGLIRSHIHPEFHHDDDDTSRVVHVIAKIMSLLRDRPRMHMAVLISELLSQNVCGGTATESNDPATIEGIKKLIFVSFGWATSLYLPDTSRLDQPFAIVSEGSSCFEKLRADPDADHVPIVGVIRELGDILPTRMSWDDPGSSKWSTQSDGDVLNVASLNFATLTKVGKVRIDWVESLSAHLDFDTANLDPVSGTITPTLKLFRYPSLCYQHSSSSSLMDRVLQDWYDAGSAPPKFTVNRLMQEILLSYSLLVLFDRRARRTFVDSTRGMSSEPDYDEELDRLCIGSNRRQMRRDFWFEPEGLRETFQANSDFPIFSARLCKIQRFVDSIQPNRIQSLWRDRRDILRWYTFWAVFVLGSINFAVSILQTALSAEQVRLARAQLGVQAC